MFRCALCHLGELERRWFNPGSALLGGVCRGICCVQRGSVANTAWTAPRDLLRASRRRGRGALGGVAPAALPPGLKEAGGWVGGWGWQAGLGVLGSAVWCRGCRLGMGVSEQLLVFCLVPGVYNSKWLLLLSSPRLLVGEGRMSFGNTLHRFSALFWMHSQFLSRGGSCGFRGQNFFLWIKALFGSVLSVSVYGALSTVH